MTTLRNKYPLSSWVLSQDQLNPGDLIAFFDTHKQEEIHAEVLSLPPSGHNEYIACRRVGSPISELVNFYDVVVYRVTSKEVAHSPTCSCGAHFTSNPKFHLSYCDFGR